MGKTISAVAWETYQLKRWGLVKNQFLRSCVVSQTQSLRNMWMQHAAYRASHRGTVLYYVMAGIHCLIPAVRDLREGLLTVD